MTAVEPNGQIFLKAGLGDEAGLSGARGVQQRSGGSMGRSLAGLGLTDEASVGRALAEAMKIERPDLTSLIVASPAASPLPAEFCRKRLVMPLGIDGRAVRLAMDGITMVRALRDDPLTRHVAILILTSESSVETGTRGPGVGVDDHILKPVEPRRLAARVKASLARTQPRAAAAS